jgi:UDP-3-O-[3-hydroxymyristoyl] glucosamine N-acyltransferase
MKDRSGEGVRTLPAADVVAIVGGELRGDPSTPVSGVAPLYRAERHEVTFLASARYAQQLATSRAGIVLVSPELAGSPGEVGARILVKQPHEAMLALLPLLYRLDPHSPGIDPTVRIGRGVRLGREVSIGPYVVIGAGAEIGDGTRIDAHVVIGDGVTVGAACHIFPHVTVYTGASLGSRVILQSGARIASDGFGYVFRDGGHQKIPHVGRCLIGDDVEIGANTTIDRGSIDDTIIGAGSKIDNLVQIGHNVHIGRLCVIVSQAGISGSTHVGDGVVIGGQAGVAGHLTIGDRAKIGAQAGVTGSVPGGESWSGYPARPHRESLRSQAALFKLARLMKRIERLVGDGE